MTRLGGVPMSVIMPPMLLAKAKGMSRRLALVPAAAAMLTTMGSIRATVPVLLTKAPMAAVTTMTRMNSRSSLFPASFSMRELIILARPVWKMAPPTTNSPTIMTTTELENPERASSGVRIWNRRRAVSEHKATMSERTFPLAKNMAERTSMMTVVHMGGKEFLGFVRDIVWHKVTKKSPHVRPPAFLFMYCLETVLNLSARKRMRQAGRRSFFYGRCRFSSLRPKSADTLSTSSSGNIIRMSPVSARNASRKWGNSSRYTCAMCRPSAVCCATA